MGKLDELRRGAGANVAQSMSKVLVRPAATHGAASPAGPDRWAGLERLPGAQRIPVDRIVRDPAQPREDFESDDAVRALAELAESIRARGVLQPIRVRWDEGQGAYVVIAGERRLRAARMAGHADAPCVIHEGGLSEAEVLMDQVAENLYRLDLQPIEQAHAFQRLMDAHGWSARRLAEELHIDHDKVSRSVKLLELPEDIQEQVSTGAVPPSAGAVLAGIADDATRRELAGRVAAGTLTRDGLAEQVRAVRTGSGGGPARAKGRGAKAGPRKVTVRSLKTPAGKVTVENRRGVDDVTIRTALLDALGQLGDAGGQGRGEAA